LRIELIIGAQIQNEQRSEELWENRGSGDEDPSDGKPIVSAAAVYRKAVAEPSK
jgi:hypothetical protein